MKTTLLTTLIVISALVAKGQWTYTYLSEPKEFMGAATYGSEVYFAGGHNETGFKSAVEVYNFTTGIWGSAGNLSVPREIHGGVTTCGAKIFFAGGFDWSASYNTVDIYDAVTQQWTVEQLSEERFSLAAVSYGSKVLFAGGFRFPGQTYKDVVDIYDTLTGEWSTAYLAVPRMGIAAAVVGDLAIFAGGVTSNSGSCTEGADIYNFSTNTWTWNPNALSQARGYASATTVDDKIIIAGGVTSFYVPTNVVDIYNATNGTWTTTSLTFPRSWDCNAATVKGKAYFPGGGTFYGSGYMDPQSIIDIYDEESNIWSIDVLSQPLINHCVLGVNLGLQNCLIVAGGKNDQGNFVSTVERLDVLTGITSQPQEDAFINVYPNPSSNNLTISAPDGITIDEVLIYNQTGQKEHQGKPINNTLDISRLEKGIYFIELITDQRRIREKFVVQ